jgi:glucose-6-phosphate 1-dehydrogenase
MTTLATRKTSGETREGRGQPAGRWLVVCGITGDLASVMTFHSLYRLEQRGLPRFPIVGLAVDDWTVGQLVDGARELIIETVTRQDRLEETWRLMQPLLDALPPVHSCKPGSRSPEVAGALVGEPGGWREPWVQS